MQPNLEQLYDVIIIGAGPAGLSAAVYTSREDLSTLVLEKAVVGGMAALTATIENYPGFEDNIGGLELSDHLEKQAKKFGAQLVTPADVQGLRREGSEFRLETSQGVLRARCVIVATGSTYSKLGIPGEAEMTGRGVHYCATCDGPIYRGKTVAVIGGGNSAVQETLFLAKFAARVIMLVRGDKLKASAALIHQLEKLQNVEVRLGAVSRSIDTADGRVASVTLVSGDKVAADGVFIFIGLLANTQMFQGTLELDDRGFIKTDLSYGTNLPGVFVAGDVRSGSTWQIASAVGEGAAAALSVRAYLDAASEAKPAASSQIA